MILKGAPQYRHISNKTQDNILGAGVKYGYASDVDQMIERLEYDLLAEHMSLIVDLKIIIYTALILGEGGYNYLPQLLPGNQGKQDLKVLDGSRKE
ncbi:MAG: hypothetical protein R2744_07945 [Bacteroidales bacterium]